MNKLFLICLSTLLIGGWSMSAQPKLTDYVNPFRGTTTLWETEDLGYERHREARTWGAETLPGASLPNAMVQASTATATSRATISRGRTISSENRRRASTIST